jgi:hypothetical protein
MERVRRNGRLRIELNVLQVTSVLVQSEKQVLVLMLEGGGGGPS